jgi:hypothetical protein
MAFLENFRREAKIRYPVELKIRAINKIRQEVRAGQRIRDEEYEKALKPVTTELVKTQKIIRELGKTNEQAPAKVSETSPANMQEAPSASYMSPFTDQFSSTILKKYNLLYPSEIVDWPDQQTKLKYLEHISKSLGSKKSKCPDAERDEIDKELNVLKKYRHLLKFQHGTGLKHYKNVRELIDRLEILMGQMTAGNDSVDIQNEAIDIVDKLLEEKKISRIDHEKLYGKIHSF